MAGTDLTSILTALGNLQASVSKDLEEIRKQKAEIQQLKTDVFNEVARGRVIRDDQRLVLSAPEIIIGNVDGSGTLYSEGGSIVIRGQKVGLEGVGTSGSVDTRATTISQTAIDPGIDGVEEVVRSQSSIIQQAKRIAIQSNDCADDGYFSQSPRTTASSGVRIHADERVEIDSSVSSEIRSDEVSNRLANATKAVTSLTTESVEAMTSATTLIGEMETLLTLQDPLTIDELTMRTTVVELDSLTEQFNALLPSVYSAINSAISSMSHLAEANRRMKALQQEQLDLATASTSFKEKSTGASLAITAEQMDVASIDGDNHIRDNAEAAIRVQTGKLDITCYKTDGSLIDDSHVRIATQDVDIATVNPTLKDDGTGDYDTVGSVSIRSKDVQISAVDYDSEKIKGQTQDSRFSVRMQDSSILSFDNEGNTTGTFAVQTESMLMSSCDKDRNNTGTLTVNAKDITLSSSDKDNAAIGSLTMKAAETNVRATDKDGKAIGQISINAKDVFIKSMDTDDKGADKSLAGGGNMVLTAENMFVGSTTKDNLSKQLQISSDKTGIYGKTTAELQQGEAKAVVQLDGGNIAIGGSKSEFFGDNTINGKTDFKSDATMKKLTADNIEAKTSFKSKNISDGIAVPGAASSAKLKAKLKEADAPQPKTKE